MVILELNKRQQCNQNDNEWHWAFFLERERKWCHFGDIINLNKVQTLLHETCNSVSFSIWHNEGPSQQNGQGKKTGKVGRRKAAKKINLYSHLYEMYIRTLPVPTKFCQDLLYLEWTSINSLLWITGPYVIVHQPSPRFHILGLHPKYVRLWSQYPFCYSSITGFLILGTIDIFGCINSPLWDISLIMVLCAS